MGVTIMVDDYLAAQLQAQAQARNLSMEALVRQILSEAVANGEDAEWQACNQRRIALIRKRFAEGLCPDEERELQQLQEMADRYVERFDERLFDDVKQLYSKARRIVDASSG